jgi:hypothetical protein
MNMVCIELFFEAASMHCKFQLEAVQQSIKRGGLCAEPKVVLRIKPLSNPSPGFSAKVIYFRRPPWWQKDDVKAGRSFIPAMPLQHRISIPDATLVELGDAKIHFCSTNLVSYPSCSTK